MTKIKLANLYNSELVSGVVLIASFIAAIIVANTSHLQEIYRNFVFFPVSLGWGSIVYKSPLIQLVNDGLMTFFFLLIGVELKFHLVCGEFQEKHKLILPSAAALGGIVAPALIYWYFNYNSPETMHGWAISIATDTAFMLGILSFFGRVIPVKLRALIIGFSLIDDAIALLILAIFYTQSASTLAIIASIVLTSFLFLLNFLKVKNFFSYLFVGIFLWIAMVQAGIHGTLSGVILALAIPVEIDGVVNKSFHSLEKFLRPVVYFSILPLFAFINSGVSFESFSLDILKTPLALGIILGLFVGKQLGIFLFSYLAVKFSYSTLPEHVSWVKFYAISVLGGIGFTLSLFIGDISFEVAEPNYVMRISVIIGSLLSACVGIGVLSFLSRRHTSN